MSPDGLAPEAWCTGLPRCTGPLRCTAPPPQVHRPPRCTGLPRCTAPPGAQASPGDLSPGRQHPGLACPALYRTSQAKAKRSKAFRHFRKSTRIEWSGRTGNGGPQRPLWGEKQGSPFQARVRPRSGRGPGRARTWRHRGRENPQGSHLEAVASDPALGHWAAAAPRRGRASMTGCSCSTRSCLPAASAWARAARGAERSPPQGRPLASGLPQQPPRSPPPA